jgi:hypothetical protein
MILGINEILEPRCSVSAFCHRPIWRKVLSSIGLTALRFSRFENIGLLWWKLGLFEVLRLRTSSPGLLGRTLRIRAREASVKNGGEEGVKTPFSSQNVAKRSNALDTETGSDLNVL